jgi:hypothetical protein
MFQERLGRKCASMYRKRKSDGKVVVAFDLNELGGERALVPAGWLLIELPNLEMLLPKLWRRRSCRRSRRPPTNLVQNRHGSRSATPAGHNESTMCELLGLQAA